MAVLAGTEDFPLELKPDSLIEPQKSLAFSEHGSAVLVVEPESASWTVLDEFSCNVLKELAGGLSFGELAGRLASHEPAEVKDFITGLCRLNFLRVNGRTFYDPKALWESGRKYPHFISLHVTNRCNFSCLYCYNSSSPARTDMALETSKYLVKRLLFELPLPSLTIEFHGGEPLLVFDEVVLPTVRYGQSLSKALGKTVNFLMQTNGSLITGRTASLLARHDIRAGISCDGSEALHNRNRVRSDGSGTYEATLGGIENLIARRRHAGTLATIERPEDYSSVLRHALSHDIHDISIRPVYPMGRAKARGGIRPENAPSFAEGFLEAADLVKEINRGSTPFEAEERPVKKRMVFRNLCTYLDLLTSKERADMCYRSPCGAGNSIIAFDTDGGIYPCEEMTGIESFRMGNVYDRGDLSAIITGSSPYQVLNERRVESLKSCGRCKWMRLCGGGCISKIAASGGDPEHGDYYCGFHKVVLEELALRISSDPSLVQDLLGTESPERKPVYSSLWRLSLGPR
ncbi:MAG: radical SAM protein [Candidatus Eremiobacteraeota bacterium]|nr:radical SAM protein [Candidatus Eremiobacteraeota bacterium]